MAWRTLHELSARHPKLMGVSRVSEMSHDPQLSTLSSSRLLNPHTSPTSAVDLLDLDLSKIVFVPRRVCCCKMKDFSEV